MDKDIRPGMKTTLHVYGMKCECGETDSQKFSQTQVKRAAADKTFVPRCLSCTEEAEAKRKWAGNFACSSCGRKRLIAVDFSKAQVEKQRKDPSFALYCKQCVSEGKAADASAEAGSAEAGSAAVSPCVEERKEVSFQAGKLGLSIERNVVNVAPKPGSQAAALGVEVGWVLHAVNEEAVGSVKADILARVKLASEGGTKPVSMTFRAAKAEGGEGGQHCTGCDLFLFPSYFSPAQLRNKGPGKQQCRECVEKRVGREEAALAAAKAEEELVQKNLKH